MILVTGANGFLGTHLVKHLLQQENCKIFALYRKSIPNYFKENKFENVNWIQCNILDIDAVHNVMQNIEQVYHCANSISFNADDAEEMVYNNLEGTANIVNACLENKIKKLLFVSSVAAISRAQGSNYITEQTPWLIDDNTSQYGISKYKAEMEVWRGSAEGLNVVIVNPTIILGEGDWNIGSSQLFKNVWNEFPYYTTGVNGFVDVKDVVNAMYLLMNSNIANERFIINQGNYSYEFIFNLIAKYFNKKPPTKKATVFLSNLVWRFYNIKKIFTGKQPLITKETAYTANSIYEYENIKLNQFLPDFIYQNFEKSIERICKYYELKK